MIKTHKSTRPKTILLPSKNEDMEKFVNSEREKISLHILNCIEYAIDNCEDMTEIFMFTGTKYYVILHEKDYISSLDHIFSCFMENEIYENCQKVKNVKDKLILFHKNIKTDCLK